MSFQCVKPKKILECREEKSFGPFRAVENLENCVSKVD